MKNKRLFVLCITLLLLAMVTGMVFAQTRGELDGVYWLRIQGTSPILKNAPGNYYHEVANLNDYPVRVTVQTNMLSSSGDYNLAAKETKHILASSLRVTKVVRR